MFPISKCILNVTPQTLSAISLVLKLLPSLFLYYGTNLLTDGSPQSIFFNMAAESIKHTYTHHLGVKKKTYNRDPHLQIKPEAVTVTSSILSAPLFILLRPHLRFQPVLKHAGHTCSRVFVASVLSAFSLPAYVQSSFPHHRIPYTQTLFCPHSLP